MAVRRARETWWRRAGMPLLTHAVLIAGCVAMLFPYLWMVGTSFKPADETMCDSSYRTTSAAAPQRKN